MIACVYQIPRLRGALIRAESALVSAVYAAHFDPGLRVFGLPIISVARGSEFHVGSRAMLVSHPVFSGPGVSHPCILRTLGAQSRLTIGDDVGMSGASIVAAESVMIGNRVLVGADVIITDTDFHPVDSDDRRLRRRGVDSIPVVIGNNVFLGMRAIVLKGVTIGDDAVVGAGSVVTGDVPGGIIVAGVPAQPIGTVRRD